MTVKSFKTYDQQKGFCEKNILHASIKAKNDDTVTVFINYDDPEIF